MKPVNSAKTNSETNPIPRGVRSGVSWSLYAFGHLVSIPMVRWDLAFLYPLYNAVMLASVDIQADLERGPWRPVDD